MVFMISIRKLEINDKFGNGFVIKFWGGGYGNIGVRFVKFK